MCDPSDSANPLLPKLANLHALELAATGADKETVPMIDAVDNHARELVNNDLDTRGQNLDQLEQTANQQIIYGYDDDGNAETLRRGLSSDERRGLQDLVTYLGNVHSAADKGRETDAFCGRDGDAWAQLVQKTQAIGQHAVAVLNAP